MALELRVLSKSFPRTGIQRCTTASWGKTKSNNGLGTTKRGEKERRGKKVTRRGGVGEEEEREQEPGNIVTPSGEARKAGR